MMIAVVSAYGQGNWKTVNYEADPLKGVSAKTVNIYTDDDMGIFYVSDWDKPVFRLITQKGMFRSIMVMGSKIIPVRVGFYKIDGTLEKKFDFTMCPVFNRMDKDISTDSYYLKGRKNIRAIMSWLKSGKGYVRFLVERLNMSEFDLKVMPCVEPPENE